MIFMFIRISFSDGSTPYVKYSQDPDTIREEVERWSENYRMKFLGSSKRSGGVFYLAIKKPDRPKYIWE